LRIRKSGTFDRRALEVCVFVYLAEALQTGDLYVVGAENFADYRAQLLPWAECEARLPAYCTTLGIAERGEDFAAALKAELTTLAAAVDAGFAANSELSIDADGTPHLKQLATTEQPAGLTEFEHEIVSACRSATSSTSSSMPNTGHATPATSGHLPGPIQN
jgi:hypothetical protein